PVEIEHVVQIGLTIPDRGGPAAYGGRHAPVAVEESMPSPAAPGRADRERPHRPSPRALRCQSRCLLTGCRGMAPAEYCPQDVNEGAIRPGESHRPAAPRDRLAMQKLNGAKQIAICLTSDLF